MDLFVTGADWSHKYAVLYTNGGLISSVGPRDQPLPTGERANLAIVSRNPIHGSATLAYRVPAAGPVELTIQDVAGRRIRTLFHGDAPVGGGAVRWDARDESGHPVPSGTYYLRLQADSGRRSSKVVVVR